MLFYSALPAIYSLLILNEILSPYLVYYLGEYTNSILSESLTKIFLQFSVYEGE